MQSYTARLKSGFPADFGAFDPGAFDPGAFDTFSGSVTVYQGQLYRVRFLSGPRMSDRFYIKRNDGRPDLIAELLNPNGTPIDLTLATSVTFKMYGPLASRAPTLRINKLVTILSAANGQIKHVWDPASPALETSVEGEFEGEFEILWSDGNKQTVPNGGYVAIIVTEDLG